MDESEQGMIGRWVLTIMCEVTRSRLQILVEMQRCMLKMNWSEEKGQEGLVKERC
jgi:hypothetical protein